MAELIDSIRDVLRAGPPMRLAVLFGSQAAGSARADSDVDIAILPSDPGLALVAELELVSRLEAALRRPVDLVRLESASAVLRWQIASTGVALVSEPPWEWTRFRAREAVEHADIAGAIERCTRQYMRALTRMR